MHQPSTAAPPTDQVRPSGPGARAHRRARVGWVLAALGVLLVLCVLSLAVGSKMISLGTTWNVLWADDGSEAAVIVRDSRLPRTALGLLAGAALGIAGAMIMALTRNPLADPGVLGVNAGAAFCVAIAVVSGLDDFTEYVWLSFAGAVLATVAVYLIASVNRGVPSPVHLVLAGIALGAVLSGVTQAITLLNPDAFNRMRAWAAGSLQVDNLGQVGSAAIFVIPGLVLALLLAHSLNALALGDDLAAAVGSRTGRVRLGGVVAVTLLCGATTAIAGPIAFVGLVIPHIARWLLGPDQRWIMVLTLVAGPILLLSADIIGRIVLHPGEIQAGLMMPFIGAPVLIGMVRRRKASGL